MLNKLTLFVLVILVTLNLSCNKMFDQGAANQKVELSISASVLSPQLRNHEGQNYEKYLDRTIEITGTIQKYSRDGSGVVNLEFDTPGSLGPFGTITCGMTDDQPWMFAHPSQQVRVIGTLKSVDIAATLSQCKIVEVAGPPLTVLDPFQLEDRYENAQEALKPKVFKKWFFIDGVMAEGKDVFGRPIPSLQTNSKHPIAIEYQRFMAPPEGKVKIGDKVRVLAVVNGFSPFNHQVVLTDAIFINHIR